MATRPTLARVAASAAVDAVTALLADGYLRLYTGPQPVDADAPTTTQVLLAELRFGDPAFRPAVEGVAQAAAIAAELTARATGTVTWFRCTQRDGQRVLDGTVGAAEADLLTTTTLIQAGAEVGVSRLTLTIPTR